MPPNSVSTAGRTVLQEVEYEPPKSGLDKTPLPRREYQLLWKSIAFHIFINVSAIYGLYLTFTSAKYQTTLLTFGNLFLSLLGISAGAHRLWAHRSFKARYPLRFFLMVLQSLAYQESVFRWVRDHRLHHKYPDDDADPYNPKRGFFYAHNGWQMVKRHPRCVEKGRKLDLSDLLNDSVIRLQKKHFMKIAVPVAIILPLAIPMYFWGETFNNAWHLNMLRYVLGAHITLTVNSVAHSFGYKTYDKRISPSDNDWVNFLAVGEGVHNYHHVFPWDFRGAEMNTFYFNVTTRFLEAMGKIGLAYDLKSATKEMVENRVNKTGDLSACCKERRKH